MQPATTPNFLCIRILRKAFAVPSLLVSVWLSLYLPAQAQSVTPVDAQLPLAAQQSITKGLTAAKQQQWLVAIRAFDEARTAAPDSPVPLYNLGLAEAQLPGRELRAICWFEAYLDLGPNAENAEAVRQEIARLDARAADTVRNILAALKGSYAAPASKLSSLTASLSIRTNDLDGALATLDSVENDQRDSVRYSIAQFLADYGRYPEAVEQAEKTQSESFKRSAYESIVTAKIERGQFSDAKDMLEKVVDGKDLGTTYFDLLFRLAEAEYKSGKVEESKALIRDGKATIDTIADSKRFLIRYATARYRTGDAEEGKKLVRTIRESMGQFSDVKSERDSKGKINIYGSVYTNRMILLCSLAGANYEFGQKQIALQLLKEAEAAAEAGQKAGEFVPVIILNWSYLGMEEWEGLRALAVRQTKSGLQTTAEEKADWLANNEKMLADEKYSHGVSKTKLASIKTLTAAASSPAQRSHAWSDYATATMSVPIITDLKATMESFATYVPKKSVFFDTSVFTKVAGQAEVLLARLGDVHVFQAKQIEFATRLEPAKAVAPPTLTPPTQSDITLPSPAEAPAAGSYMVTLASQRSQEDAESSARALQKQYNGQLGGHQPIIRRVDLGSKGAFYRVAIGPFITKAEGSRVCENIKAVGGLCTVVEN